jgi:hypothetical protein
LSVSLPDPLFTLHKDVLDFLSVTYTLLDDFKELLKQVGLFVIDFHFLLNKNCGGCGFHSSFYRMHLFRHII